MLLFVCRDYIFCWCIVFLVCCLFVYVLHFLFVCIFSFSFSFSFSFCVVCGWNMDVSFRGNLEQSSRAAAAD